MKVVCDVVKTTSIVNPVAVIIDKISYEPLKDLEYSVDKTYLPVSLCKIFENFIGKKVLIKIKCIEIINDKKDFKRWRKQYTNEHNKSDKSPTIKKSNGKVAKGISGAQTNIRTVSCRPKRKNKTATRKVHK